MIFPLFAYSKHPLHHLCEGSGRSRPGRCVNEPPKNVCFVASLHGKGCWFTPVVLLQSPDAFLGRYHRAKIRCMYVVFRFSTVQFVVSSLLKMEYTSVDNLSFPKHACHLLFVRCSGSLFTLCEGIDTTVVMVTDTILPGW